MTAGPTAPAPPGTQPVAPGSILPAPGGAPGGAVAPGSAGSVGSILSRGLEGTPGLLRKLAALAVVASLLFGAVGALAFRGWHGALSDARAQAAQMVRIQTVQNDLVKADAAATTAYLQGGVESTALSATYDAAITEAATLLAEAAATSADVEQLTVANAGLADYTGLIEQARANNRQGLQVGAAYLRQAGTVLRGDIVPALESISSSAERRLSSDFRTLNIWTAVLAVGSLLALAGLVAAQVVLASRTKRRINLPLAVATGLLLLAAALSTAVLFSTANRVQSAADGPYQVSANLADARTAAFDAKSQESLGLIARGNAASFESTAQSQLARANADLKRIGSTDADPGTVATALNAWAAQHTQVRKLDDGGSWVQARNLAIGKSQETFAAFDDVSAKALDASAAQVDSALGSGGVLQRVLGWGILALGIIAAIASLTGISERLREYR